MPSTAAREIQTRLREGLQAAADPIRAAQAQAYMRSKMPFFGVTMPKVRQLAKEIAKAAPPSSSTSWRETAEFVWAEAVAREERYFCETWLALRVARPWQTPDLFDLYAGFVESGGWWDLVDWLATHRVGDLLRGHRVATTPKVRGLMKSANMWHRRTAIICQNRHGPETDLSLLFDAIAAADESVVPTPSTTTWAWTKKDEAFFRRKAIGWALRDLRKHRPDVVDDFLREHRGRLSGLSVREALKHADPKMRHAIVDA